MHLLASSRKKETVTWHEQVIISDNPTCTTTCRLIRDTAREDRLYRWQLYGSDTDPYDGNIRGWLVGVIADLAAVPMRRNGPLIQVADVSMIPRIKTIEDKWGQRVT